ncbi:MAG: deoxyribonuclease IV, partial [Candidatus Sumerlaeia bacterium]|nr:deoxyribonuclease IV [Candidatus Sumerlaeia bacterium]
ALNWILSHPSAKNVKILLESTSGQGDNICYCFSHLREILDSVQYPRGVGICLDTCHIFSAGYDLRTADKYEQTLNDFINIVGLKHLYVIHLNDSKFPLGSRRDRHEHIGKGKLGIEPFRYLLNDDRLQHLPMIIETPKGQGNRMDIRNLNLLRRLLN